MTKPTKPISGETLEKRLGRLRDLAHFLRQDCLEEKDRYWLADALDRIAADEDPIAALDIKGGPGQGRKDAIARKQSRIIDVMMRVDGLVEAAVGTSREGNAYNEALHKACKTVAKQLGMKSDRVRTIWDQHPEWRGRDTFDYLQAL